MVHILGVNLIDTYKARFALTKIFGIGPHVSHRLCARFQIHDKQKVKDLTAFQITALTSFLSSPATAQRLPHYPLADPDYVPPPTTKNASQLLAEWNVQRITDQRNRELRLQDRKARFLPINPVEQARVNRGKVATGQLQESSDPLYKMKILSELKREIRENVYHQRMIGSYIGKRHAMRLPVRGQNTQGNAKTAKKMNRL